MIKVSVIVPVYNGEEHLRQCMDSICGQTLQDIEIIVVDDGSTDSTCEILKEYEQADSRVQILHQDNLYAGVARNLGKAHARGEYLAFWDADDFFELNALEVMYDKAVEQNADICVCGVNQYFEEKDVLAYHAGYMDLSRIPADTEVFNRETNPDYILNFTNAVVWNKLFRKEFIEQCDLNFQPVRNLNDIYFVIHAMCMAKSITTVTDALINYRKNQEGSLTGTLSKVGIQSYEIWVQISQDLKKRNIFPERSFANRAVSSILFLLQQSSDYDMFCRSVKYLQDIGLKELAIDVREEGYYYNHWHDEVIPHLIEDKPEELLMYLERYTFLRLKMVSSIKRRKDQIIRNKKKTVERQSEKISNLRDKIAKQEERIEKQKDKIARQSDKIQNQKDLLNLPLVRLALKIYKLFKKI